MLILIKFITMGCDYYAHTIIGLRLTEDDLINEETGEYVKEYSNNDNDDYNGIITIYDMKGDIVYEVKRFGEYYYVIADMNSVWYMGDESVCEKSEFSLEMLCEKRTRMRDDLSEIGVWDNSKFGIYTIIECLY